MSSCWNGMNMVINIDPPPTLQVDYIELEGRTMLPVPGHTRREKYEFGTLTHFAYKVMMMIMCIFLRVISSITSFFSGRVNQNLQQLLLHLNLKRIPPPPPVTSCHRCLAVLLMKSLS